MSDQELTSKETEHGKHKHVKKKTIKKGASTATKLQKDYQSLTNEFEVLKDKYLRLLAEFDNYKKRREREVSEFIEYANVTIIEELLTVLDDIERSLNSSDKVSTESLHQGVELIYKKFLNILERKGLERIKAQGETFNPELHDALMYIASDEAGSNVILDEIARGYKIKNKIIRHSKVIVSK